MAQPPAARAASAPRGMSRITASGMAPSGSGRASGADSGRGSDIGPPVVEQSLCAPPAPPLSSPLGADRGEPQRRLGGQVAVIADQVVIDDDPPPHGAPVAVEQPGPAPVPHGVGVAEPGPVPPGAEGGPGRGVPGAPAPVPAVDIGHHHLHRVVPPAWG
ncbi:MAG: hypothetical protein ACK559_18295, partial [bacterium]